MNERTKNPIMKINRKKKRSWRRERGNDRIERGVIWKKEEV